jgi:KUP system potassium uptake protein
VTLTMMIDTILAFFVVRALWKWGWGKALAFLAVFFAVDLAFFSANIVKVLDGGWFPLVLGVGVSRRADDMEAGPRAALTERMQAGHDAAGCLFIPVDVSRSARCGCRGTGMCS